MEGQRQLPKVRIVGLFDFIYPKEKIIETLYADLKKNMYLLPETKRNPSHPDSILFRFFTAGDLVLAQHVLSESEEFVERLGKDFYAAVSDTIGHGSVVIMDFPSIARSTISLYEDTQNGIRSSRIKLYIDLFAAACHMKYGAQDLHEREEMVRTGRAPGSGGIIEKIPHGDGHIYSGYFFASTKLYLLDEQRIGDLVSIAKQRMERMIQKGNRTQKPRTPIDHRLRHEVFKRDGYRCVECGAGRETKTLHVDHIIPVAQGGSDELDNLQTLCEDCNLAKSNKAFRAPTPVGVGE